MLRNAQLIPNPTHITTPCKIQSCAESPRTQIIDTCLRNLVHIPPGFALQSVRVKNIFDQTPRDLGPCIDQGYRHRFFHDTSKKNIGATGFHVGYKIVPTDRSRRHMRHNTSGRSLYIQVDPKSMYADLISRNDAFRGGTTNNSDPAAAKWCVGQVC